MFHLQNAHAVRSSIPNQNPDYSNRKYFAIRPCFSQGYVSLNSLFGINLLNLTKCDCTTENTNMKNVMKCLLKNIQYSCNPNNQFSYVLQTITYNKTSILYGKHWHLHSFKKLVTVNYMTVKRLFYYLRHFFIQVNIGSCISINYPLNNSISWQDFPF